MKYLYRGLDTHGHDHLFSFHFFSLYFYINTPEKKRSGITVATVSATINVINENFPYFVKQSHISKFHPHM